MVIVTRINIILIWLYIQLVSIRGILSFAFTVDAPVRRTRTGRFHLYSTTNNNTPGPAGDLTSTLARLDQQWKLQQKKNPRSRWAKIVIENEEKNQVGTSFETSIGTEDTTFGSPPSSDYVYLLEPPQGTRPSSLIVFIGGAGLGQFPQVAYNEFLTRLSNRLNAAVIAAPYTIGLDHFSIAKKVGELTRKAIIHCEDDSQRMYPTNIPTYLITHSLGGKLATIYMAATGQQFEGIGIMSFNNFGFSQTIGMAKQFAQTLQKNLRTSTNSDVMDQIFSFAENIVSGIGIDFTPSSSEMERIISVKYDENQQRKTRLFVFDEDNLDSTPSFVRACQGEGPTVSHLPGTHLTPVYFKLGIDELPEEARDIAREATGGFESASFGNEEELNELVDEVSNWILGRPTSRRQPMISSESSFNTNE